MRKIKIKPVKKIKYWAMLFPHGVICAASIRMTRSGVMLWVDRAYPMESFKSMQRDGYRLIKVLVTPVPAKRKKVK